MPVVQAPGYSDMIAADLVKQLKIQSPKDKNALAEAKDVAYKQGFYNGRMLQGTFKGEPVTEAKGKVQKEMIDAGLALSLIHI